MANFLRHVGKVGDRKVAVIFRQIPNEEHMCLLVYTETMGSNLHDPLMTAIESPQGQASKDLADALNRAYTKDGKIILQMLHAEGMMKKMQTNQVVMTPAPNTTIRLNELNTMLDEMDRGEAAVRRMAEIDASRGLQDPADVARRMRGESTVNMPGTDGALGNDSLAQNLMNQASKMSAEARGLLAESDRLQQEARALMPAINTTPEPVLGNPVKKKAGRPKKAAVVG